MFSYVKLKINDITKTEPTMSITRTTILGTESESDHVDTFYFRLPSRILRTRYHDYSTIGYMLAEIPLRLLNERYLYLAISQTSEKVMVFVEPKLFEGLGKKAVTEMITQMDYSILTGQANENLPDPISDFYLAASIFYELTGASREKYGHQYLTEALIHRLEPEREIFEEKYEYIVHHEPLVYYLTRKRLIFLAEEDLEKGQVRLLETNNEGILFEVKKIAKDAHYGRELMVDSNFTLKEVEEFKRIVKELKEMELFLLE